MSKNSVEVIYRGKGPFEVDRKQLAKNLQVEQAFALEDGVRPGQPVMREGPLSDKLLSADVLATGITIVTSPGVPIIGKRTS